MNKYFFLLVSVIFISLSAETLFQVKDSSDNVVLDVASDGLRIFNEGDTLMVISSGAIKAFIDQNAQKGLARSFSVTSSTNIKAGQANVMEVTTDATTLREGELGERYTDFSPENMFLGLKSGLLTEPGYVNYTDVGKNNLFIGNYAGFNHTEGMNNIFLGTNSGYITTYGNRNIFLGVDAGYNNKTGGDNVYIGTEAGKGYQSGSIYSNSSHNVSLGVQSGYTIKTGSQNVFLGFSSGYKNEDGDYNVFLGSLSGWKNLNGIENVYVGYGSGAFNTGSNNVFLGRNGNLDDRSISGSVFLGNNAGSAETTSNKLYIDNSATTTPLIYGDFANDFIRINGYLSIEGLEIENLGSSNLGLDGDVVPHSSVSFDLGNNVAGEYWDDVVAQDFITYTVKDRKGIKAMGSGLNKLTRLKPVSYKDDREKFGLIPEELEKIIPQAVVSQDIDIDPETGETIVKETDKGIVYDQLIPVLIRSIQEQQEMINELRNEISELKRH